jgi:hypothetical protein
MLGPPREQGDTTNLLDPDVVEILLEAFHQSGARVGLVSVVSVISVMTEITDQTTPVVK